MLTALITKRRFPLFFIALPACLLAGTAHGQDTETRLHEVHLATGDDYPPYVSSRVENGGLFAEIIDRAYETVGIEVHIRRFPWKRAYTLARIGKFDGTYSWGWRPDRAKDFHYSDPIYCTRQQLFTRPDLIRQFGNATRLLNSNGEASICLPSDWALAPPLETPLAEGRIARTAPNNMSNCLLMLASGRTDFVQVDPLNAHYTLDQLRTGGQWTDLELSGIAALPGSILQTSTSHYIIPKITRNGPEVLEAFNRGLSEIRENGLYREILQRHFGQQPFDFQAIFNCSAPN